MKKILALILALVMMLPSVAAIAEAVDFSEPMDIEIFSYYVMDIAPDDSVVQFINEKFNVNLKFTITLIDNYDTTLNMRIASGDIPDWMRMHDQVIYNQMYEDQCLLNITPFIEKYNFENIRAQTQLPNALLLADANQQFYRVPDSTGCLNNTFFLRGDWFEKAGLPIPTTYEELKTAFETLIEADYDGNNTIGITSWLGYSCILSFSGAWTGYNTWGLKDGELSYEFTDPNMKGWLKYFRDLYKEGILDPEFMSTSYIDAMEKFASGRSVSLVMNLNNIWYNNNLNNLLAHDPNAYIAIPLPMPAGPMGNVLNSFFGFQADSAFSANLSEEKAARILAIMDYLLSDEGRELMLYGMEGEHHDVVDGKKVQREEYMNQVWGQTQHLLGELADFGSNDLVASDPLMKDWKAWQETSGALRANKLNYYANDEATTISVNLNEIRDRYFVAFLTGEMDIDACWDQYVAEMEAANLGRLKDLIGAYVDEMGIQLDAVASVK
ncbi:MAG: extracellular solute-binding protein [Clostridia bacterium]|nr:extracellular solute-binding protein [Clostridia bacterium]